MKSDATLGPAQAQRLMSQLIDGELASSDAQRLQEYLEENPDAIDWMESLDLLRNSHQDAANVAVPIESIHKGIDEDQSQSKKLIAFPAIVRALGAAAAVAAVASVTWLGLNDSESTTTIEPALVEFVTTDIPDASTFVYADEESGWTVVWVESDAAADERG